MKDILRWWAYSCFTGAVPGESDIAVLGLPRLSESALVLLCFMPPSPLCRSLLHCVYRNSGVSQSATYHIVLERSAVVVNSILLTTPANYRPRQWSPYGAQNLFYSAKYVILIYSEIFVTHIPLNPS